MKSKSRISGLVLATVFGLGMASSGLASAQNGGVLPPLSVSGENIAGENSAVGSEVVGESFSPTERTDSKDGLVISEQDSISTASGESPDETQKDDFTANGKTSDASVSIENLSEGKSEASNKNPDEAYENNSTASGETSDTSVLIENLSEEKGEVRDESLEPAEEANGEDGPVISEQEDLLATSGENPDEAQKDDFTANGETDGTFATTENLGKGKGSGTVVSVEPSKDKKLATNNRKAKLLKGAGVVSLVGLGSGIIGVAAAKLGNNGNAALENLKKQNEELNSNATLENLKKQNEELNGRLSKLELAIKEQENKNGGLEWCKIIFCVYISYACMMILQSFVFFTIGVILNKIEVGNAIKSFVTFYVPNALTCGLYQLCSVAIF